MNDALSSEKRIIFLTGTRADFGKLKSLILKLQQDSRFSVHVFVTGMHMLTKYGYTCEEVEKSGVKNIHKFINQNSNDAMDTVLVKTISGLSDFVHQIRPHLIIIHGDRVEALAGASVGALNNILVAHIEGGEVSGTVDELIRHAVTKLSHIHFAANSEAAKRLMQLGESQSSIFEIGSPDIDIMNSDSLPTFAEVQRRYDFTFKNYGILIFHPVVSEVEDLYRQASTIVDEILASNHNYIVIYPNNDLGTDQILREYERLKSSDRIKMYPSMRFEFFLTLLKHAQFILGNSSSGVREAPHYGVPTINLGSRQQNRAKCPTIHDIEVSAETIRRALCDIDKMERTVFKLFGHGDSAEKFYAVVTNEKIWMTNVQKYFIDRLV